jgi:hypothetical protein
MNIRVACGGSRGGEATPARPPHFQVGSRLTALAWTKVVGRRIRFLGIQQSVSKIILLAKTTCYGNNQITKESDSRLGMRERLRQQLDQNVELHGCYDAKLAD